MKRLRTKASRIDGMDATILKALAADARTTIAELARKVGLSAPAVAERVKRLEESGVIQGYAAQINPAALGFPLAVHIRIRPMPGQLSKFSTVLDRLEAIVECDRITGDDCYVAKAHVASVQELETLIDQIIPFGTTNTAIIQSSPVARRLPFIPTAGEPDACP